MSTTWVQGLSDLQTVKKVLDSFNSDGDTGIKHVSKNKSGPMLGTSTANGNILTLSTLKEIPLVESTLSGC